MVKNFVMGLLFSALAACQGPTAGEVLEDPALVVDLHMDTRLRHLIPLNPCDHGETIITLPGPISGLDQESSLTSGLAPVLVAYQKGSSTVRVRALGASCSSECGVRLLFQGRIYRLGFYVRDGSPRVVNLILPKQNFYQVNTRQQGMNP